MKLVGRNHPCGEKERAGDETGWKKSSLRKKKASWGCNRVEEVILAEEKSKLGMKTKRQQRVEHAGL